MIAIINTGGSKNNSMSLGFGIEHGWEKVRAKLEQVLRWYPELRVLLHLPHGRPAIQVGNRWKPESKMSTTAFHDLMARGFDQTISTFEAAWGDFPNEVICYVGSPHNDDRIQGCLSDPNWNASNGLAKANALIEQSLEPFHRIGASIALDNAIHADPESEYPARRLTYELLTSLESTTRVYIEATAKLTQRHLWSKNMIIKDKPLLSNRHLGIQHQKARGVFPRIGSDDWYTNDEVISLIYPRCYPNVQKNVTRVQQLMRLGITPALSMILLKRLIRKGVKPDDLCLN